MKTDKLKYPFSMRENVEDDYHGTLVSDPYRWLEEQDSSERSQWVADQNESTRDYLSRISFRTQIKDRLTSLWNYPKEGVPRQEGEYYYFFRNDGLQNQAVLYRSREIGGDIEVFLDPNRLSDDGTAALNGVSFSHDGHFCAYSVSHSGSDWAEIRIVDSVSGETLSDRIQWVKFSIPSWSADSHGFYYSAYDAPLEGNEYSGQNRFHKIYFHTLGSYQADDRLVYADLEHPLRYFHGSESRDGRHVFIAASEGTHGTEILCRETSSPELPFTVILPGFENDYEIIYASGDKALVMTNENAPNFRLVSVSLSGYVGIVDVIAEKPDMPLESVTAVGGFLMATYLENASSVVEQYDMEGNFVRRIDLEGIGSTDGFRGKDDALQTFYSFSSYTSPASIYRYDLESGLSELLSKPDVDFDPSLFTTKQLFFTSKDGTTIPMFVVGRRDMPLDGRNPMVMYGYGGFNISHLPAFNPSVIMFLERGGIFVDVTLRGGGEYGEKWHRGGMLEKKQNVFDDFISAAEFLIAGGYTSPERLAIMGGSNGGLLVGACMTQRPDLFAVAVPQVGVLDMLRYHMFTIGWGWVVEYGSSDDPEQFEYLRRYSPLHNIKDGTCYPATLVTTAEHDDRVVPAHSFKFAAALQHAQGCAKPVLIRIDSDAGHGAGKPTDKRIDEAADIYSFILANTSPE